MNALRNDVSGAFPRLLTLEMRLGAGAPRLAGLDGPSQTMRATAQAARTAAQLPPSRFYGGPSDKGGGSSSPVGNSSTMLSSQCGLGRMR